MEPVCLLSICCQVVLLCGDFNTGSTIPCEVTAFFESTPCIEPRWRGSGVAPKTCWYFYFFVPSARVAFWLRVQVKGMHASIALGMHISLGRYSNSLMVTDAVTPCQLPSFTILLIPFLLITEPDCLTLPCVSCPVAVPVTLACCLPWPFPGHWLLSPAACLDRGRRQDTDCFHLPITLTPTWTLTTLTSLDLCLNSEYCHLLPASTFAWTLMTSACTLITPTCSDQCLNTDHSRLPPVLTSAWTLTTLVCCQP